MKLTTLIVINVLALLLGYSLPATAQAAGPSATLTIAPSFTNTDGTATSGTLTCNLYQGQGTGKEGATPVQTGIACSNPSVTVTVTAGLVDGATTCFQVTEVEGAQESAKSAEACKTFPPATPVAPGLTVQ